MEYKAYIESINGFPIADWGVSALLGFKEAGMSVILFEDIEEVPTSKYNIVVANIDFTESYFNRFGIKLPALNIPAELNHYDFLHRHMWILSMASLRSKSDFLSMPLFIKPVKVKQFISGVITKHDSIQFLHEVPDTSLVLCSDVIDIVSEYRCYVYQKKLQGIFHYQGDIRIFPDPRIIDLMLDVYKSQPNGFSLDVGITREGKTILIECNDGWSLGNYGLSSGKYKNLLMSRWIEIFKGV